jgi:hypothetical protein
MKVSSQSALLAGAALLAGCSRMYIAMQTDPAYDFSRITTYQWIDPPADILEENSTQLDIRLQQALNNELAAQGWMQVLDASNATVQVAYYLEIRTHHEFTGTATGREGDFSGGMVFDRNTREWNYEQRQPDQVVYVVEDGTVHFTMHEPGLGRSIWSATVGTEIDRSKPSEEVEQLFGRIARKLFEKFNRNHS